MERDYTKYKQKEFAWRIPGTTVSGIIIDALDKLVQEMLDPTPLTISRHFQDRRTDHEYYADIIEGWLVEDLIVEWFKSRKKQVVRHGSDKDRCIQRSSGRNITTKVDLVELMADGSMKNLEIQMARARLPVYHLKEGKGNRLIKENGTLMFIILPDDVYFEADSDFIKASELKPNPRWGGKVCYWLYPTEYKRMGD